MFGIGKDTAVRDTIGITIAIFTAVLLFGAAELIPAPAAPVVEPATVHEAAIEAPSAPAPQAPEAAQAPAPFGRI